MQARIACQDAIPRIYSGHANTAVRLVRSPINCQPVSEHEPCLFLYHPACLLGLGMSMHGPANGSQTRMRCRQPPKHPRGMLATPGGDGTCWGGESRGVGSGGLGTSPNGPLDMTRPSPERATSCGQVLQRDASAMDAARGSTATAPGGARPTKDRDWRSMASATCCRALVRVLAH
jgi:hypothetical protein